MLKETHCRITMLCMVIFTFTNALLAHQNINRNSAPDNFRAGWINFTSDSGAFSVKLPSQPDLLVSTINNADGLKGGIKVHLFHAADTTVNYINYIVRYNDYPPGYYMADRQKLFDALLEEFKTKGTLLEKPEKTWKDGNEGLEVKMMMSDKYSAVLRLYTRGNRVYLLLKHNLFEGKIPVKNDNFFYSFAFEKFKTSQLEKITDPGKTFEIMLPGNPKIIPDSTETDNTSFLQNTVNYYAVNPFSGATYTLERSSFSAYYRNTNADSLVISVMDNLIGEQDSIERIDTLNSNGLIGREFISSNPENTVVKRKKLWIDNGNFFCLQCVSGRDDVTDETNNKIFESYHGIAANKQFDLKNSKLKQILTDVESIDTVVSHRAIGSLSFYFYTPDELPLVYKALRKHMSSEEVKLSLLSALKQVNTAETIPFLKTYYNEITNKDTLKATVLSTLGTVRKGEALTDYLNLLTTETPFKLGSYYQLFKPLSDSLSYLGKNYSQILPLLKSYEYRNEVLDLSTGMLSDDENGRYKDLIVTNLSELTAFAEVDLSRYLAEKDKENSHLRNSIFNYLTLFDSIPNQPMAEKFTAKLLLSSAPDWMTVRAAASRLINNLVVEQSVIDKHLANLNTRYDIMSTLYTYKKEGLIASKYKSPEEFSKACMNEYLFNEEDYPEKLELLGDISVSDSTYYVFSFKFSGDEVEYMGVVGPYGKSFSIEFEDYHAFTAWEEKQKKWKDQAKELIASQSSALE